MSYQIHFPRKILQDETITNRQKNILIHMYLYASGDNIYRNPSKFTAQDLGYKNHQNISKLLNPLLGKYLEQIKDPANKNHIWYKLMDNKVDFIQFDSQLWKQFKKQQDLIVEYFKYKNSYFLLRLLENQKSNFKPNRFIHAKLGNYVYLDFCKIEQDLFDNGLIDWNNYYVDFLREPEAEAQIGVFILNSNEKEKKES